MKILIVDDKKENLYLLETLLKGSGYEVESASNGAEALEKLRTQRFDMIISDILMPVMDGFQFCRKVKADNELKNIPFVFYTATYTNSKDEEFSLKLGADKFLRKPIEPDEFIKIIQGIVEDVEKGKIKLKKPASEEEEEVFKLYSERLIHKLEHKVLKLEKEITERKRAEEALRRVNRARKVLSECNQAVVRSKKESELLHNICELIVKAGGYRLAWVGFAEQDKKKTVRPVAQAGFEKGYLETLNITWKDIERGRGPTGTAIRTGRHYIARNIQTDPNFAPWRDEATKRGYASSIALPLIDNGRTFGALNIYAEEPDAFDAEEVKLLMELADDLAYGIMALRTNVERKRAEENLRKAHDELEIRVKERTTELRATNEQLQQEITERKRTEIALAEAKVAAESANKAKSDFLASMSHELRTPLNAIIGFSEVLGDQIIGEINEKQKKFINNVLTSARHLLSLINDILDLSKVEAGKLELYLSNISIKNLLENSLIMIKEKALKHSITLDIDIPIEISELEITADERKIKQIMFNLLSNAVKFTPDGGAINVNVNCKESEIIISVADTGIGIKPEDQKSIFREFEQLDSSYSKTHEGTGLGLTLTKRLVELHGGHIWVESEGKGKGSKFTFAIPINKNVNNSKN
ncbi:MAG: response regulator [Candidatus Cloacimonetes bacterium]|nr:response regulator [Candidatus Cloacimonadota bacterium]